jgi:hypothetical protein
MLGAGGQLDPEEHRCYRESFDTFDWNNNGKISYGSLQVRRSKIPLTRYSETGVYPCCSSCTSGKSG